MSKLQPSIYWCLFHTSGGVFEDFFLTGGAMQKGI